MADFFYIWMRRNRPRGKGEKPGDWEPVPAAAPHRVSHYYARCTVENNRMRLPQEYALFCVPAGALGRVDPAEVRKIARIADGKAET